jgi:phosphatidate phosphatase APP1
MSRRPNALTNLQHDETVVLFPSLGHLSPDGETWNVQVHGEVYSQQLQVGLAKRLLLRMLKRAMRAPEATLEDPIFQQRISRWLAADEKGKRIAIKVGPTVFVLPKKSHKNGHFFGTLKLTPKDVAAFHATNPASRSLTLDVCGPAGDSLLVQGQVYLLGEQGVSVISDIDDTIKHSHVACKRTLLRNTFLKRFEPIAGMADIYRTWADAGVAFHYVSSCPWQLYRQIADHLTEVGFPAGSYHLRSFRLRDHLIRRLLMLRRSGKAKTILRILKTFPHRKFILVGDSGEHDPEIYGAAARKYPEQVQQILIRRIDTQSDTAARYEKAFRGVRRDIVRMFRDPAEIADIALPSALPAHA